MNIEIAVTEIAERPLGFLSSECAMALGSFFYGYRLADASASIVLQELANELNVPNQASACRWGYLTSSDSATGFQQTIAALVQVLRRTGVPSPVAGPYADLTFVEIVKDAILQGRPGMVLPEPTVVSMHDYFRGFLVGLSAVRPDEALRQTHRLAAFESWIRASYGGLKAPWYAIIRAYYGICDDGLKKFLELWHQFEMESPEPPH